ncbi:PREDICTED: PRUPE_4G168600 [Prunus dulcis]|uniref:PREDICTED: PRUPE_4G168600 n=2 Tax=Prunus dulcis TaxID=3755 RepID=A0A5E4EPQ0_PRUDU|nr:PREDICTED: PRUPE_4G168600 [Prunus dulcis]
MLRTLNPSYFLIQLCLYSFAFVLFCSFLFGLFNDIRFRPKKKKEMCFKFLMQEAITAPLALKPSASASVWSSHDLNKRLRFGPLRHHAHAPPRGRLAISAAE